MQERKPLEERYLGSATSIHLRLDLEKPGDVDLLIAAGWIKESLATSLYRLRGEFDRAAGPLRLAVARIIGEGLGVAALLGLGNAEACVDHAERPPDAFLEERAERLVEEPRLRLRPPPPVVTWLPVWPGCPQPRSRQIGRAHV